MEDWTEVWVGDVDQRLGAWVGDVEAGGGVDLGRLGPMTLRGAETLSTE